MSIYNDYTIMESRLKRDPNTYYSGEELAQSLRRCEGRPMPPLTQKYYRDFLAGKIKKRRGRKNNKWEAREVIRTVLATRSYNRLLARFQKYNKSHEGGSPYERAIKLVRKKYFPHLSERSVLNLISKFNS